MFIKIQVKPSFLIVGAQKAATSSLFEYLAQHPLINYPQTKEIGFFSQNRKYEKGIEWYHAQFSKKRNFLKPYLTFEATPEYLYHPDAAQRIFDYNPKMKIIIILREPVSRAFSAWNMYREFKENGDLKDEKFTNLFPIHLPESEVFQAYYQTDEFPSFEEVVEKEMQYINADADTSTPKEPSIIRRGIYYPQVKRYFDLFPRENILVLNYLDFLKPETLNNLLKVVFDFIELLHKGLNEIKTTPANKRSYVQKINFPIQQALNEFYDPFNQKLWELIGKTFTW